LQKDVFMPDSQTLQPTPPSDRAANYIAAALLAILAVLLVTSVRQQSQVFDESTHLLAGFEYWKHADFGRNPEHPPFAKLLASLPLLSMGLHEPPALPFPFFKGQDLVNGTQFLYTANADAILMRSHLMMALFSLTLGLLVFLATREIFGPLAAVLALFLFTFEPNLLANGAIVTTDMPLACLLFASVYTFYRYCNKPSARRLALCAIVAALAIVAKHSGILVLPTLVLLALVDLFLPTVGNTAAAHDRKQHLRRLCFALITICIVSYLVLWTIYGLRYAARPGQLQMVPSLTAYAAALTHPLQRNLITFFARRHLLPEAYLYGWVDILLTTSRPSFLFGHVYGTGQWFFFPAVFLIKTTLTLLILLLLVPFVLFARIANRRREFIFLTIPIAFFLLAAISSQINMGVRYLLPIYPFCIVLAAAAAASLFHRSTVAKIAVAALLLFTFISSLHCYPNFLAYSNELFGGPSHSYRIVTDANADWGQGLKWTKTYLDQHPDPNCWFDYHGNPGVPIAYYGIPCKQLLSGFLHIIRVGGGAPIPSTISGTVLVSSTDTSGILWGPGNLNPYAPFRDRTPDDTIGNIILVYRGTFNVPLLAAESNASAAIGLLRQGQLTQALALAQTAAQQAPDSADVNATLGQILLASGRTAEGRQAIANALHLAQTNHPEYQKDRIDQLQHPQTNP
jgi:Dolichyl-phosphate-mannose-protein mannosyltransferase/Tetratricopeptide repeat